MSSVHFFKMSVRCLSGTARGGKVVLGRQMVLFQDLGNKRVLAMGITWRLRSALYQLATF